MNRTRKPPTAEELADRRQHAAELAVRRAYEATTPAERLAHLEALDPSQKRPPKRPCIWDRVAFMAWDTCADLGVQPLHHLHNSGTSPVICTRCDATGFLNLHQVDEETLRQFDETGDHAIILAWIAANSGHDVSVCDCCGDGEAWHGTPGEHHPEDAEPWPECY